jgi:DNA-binding GntR family transcriptional regulator
MSIEDSPRVSTVDAVADALRARILSGEIAPGTQFREVELSKAYGVGRHTLRAALQALSHEGLLSHEPNRGVFLPRFTRGDVEDLFLIRTALEVEAARLLVARKAPIDDAIRAVEELEALTGEEPWGRVIEIDLRFHSLLIGALRSPRMDRSFESLKAELRLLIAQLKPSYDRPDKIGAEHRLVLDGILSGRSDRAARAVREHLDQGMWDLVAVTA